MGDFLALLSGQEGCAGAAEVSGVMSAELSGLTITLPEGFEEGTYRVCHASSESGGGNDTDFMEQAFDVQFSAPTIRFISSRESDGTLSLTLSDLEVGDRFVFISNSSSVSKGLED